MFRLFAARSARTSSLQSTRQLTTSAVRRDAQAEAKKAAEGAKSTAQGASKQLDGALEKAKELGAALNKRAQPYVGCKCHWLRSAAQRKNNHLFLALT